MLWSPPVDIMGPSPARDSNTPGGVSLHVHALTGTPARLAELSLIAAMATVVLLVHRSAGASAAPWLSLYVPLLALALGRAIWSNAGSLFGLLFW